MTIEILMRSGDDDIYTIALHLGLSTSAIYKFLSDCHRIMLTFDVDKKTGDARVTHVNGRRVEDKPHD